MKKINVGVIGCGNIANKIYFPNLIQTFLNIRVHACADLNPEAADAAAKKWEIPVLSIEQMLDCAQIDIILNLTTPQAHFELCQRALLAGKHVYVEKPLSLSLEQARRLVALAEEKGLMLGCAPDTFLGAGIQTCRKLIDDGFIGKPVGAAAFMLCRGHEHWHPDPGFYYKAGGGPMLDMGPYYLTALVNLLGPVREVAAMSAKTFETRRITSAPQFGQGIDVEVDTHVNALLRFEGGAIGSLTTSFDVCASNLPRIEVHGTEGTLIAPDPNTFGGPVKLATRDGDGFRELPLTHGYAENSRGLGLSDMAECLLDGRRDLRAGGVQACHVLEIMLAMDTANRTGRTYSVATPFTRSRPMKMGLVKGLVE